MRSLRWNFSLRLRRSDESTVRFVRTLVVLSLLLCASNLLSQEQTQDRPKFEVDLSELQKEIDKVAAKPYSLGGFLEFQPTLLGIDRDSTFYRLKFPRRNQGSTFDQYNFRLRLEGAYKKDIFSVFFKTDTLVRNEFEGWDEDTKLFEAYASVKPSPSFILEAGKKVMKWGKGYAWNPVSFVARPKNPEDPEEALEGATVATADYIRSFDGPLKTATLTAAVVPVYPHVNAKSGELYHTNFASKLYLLAYDTDLDFMVFTGESRTTRYGFDFSKNLTTNFEIHGEFSVVNNFKSKFINETGRNFSTEREAISYLLGLRYLTEKETTYILEYYRDGTGLSRKQMTDFFSFADASYRNFVATGNKAGLVRAAKLAKGPYGNPNPMRDYLYFRVSQKEPFDVLYLTPALTAIINPNDGSFNVLPEITYSPLTNLELRLKGAILVGRSHTDFGEKQNDYRLELRLRYFFGL